jgi:hypothetical protein
LSLSCFVLHNYWRHQGLDDGDVDQGIYDDVQGVYDDVQGVYDDVQGVYDDVQGVYHQ